VFQVIGIAHPKEVRETLRPALSMSFVEARKKLRDLMIVHGFK
jgi:replication factor C small subunit